MDDGNQHSHFLVAKDGALRRCPEFGEQSHPTGVLVMDIPTANRGRRREVAQP
jgi:hypothetical protein